MLNLKQKNGGPSTASNTAIRAACAKVLALIDADDIWEANYLEFQMAALAADPSIDVLYPNGWFFGDTSLAGRELMEFSRSDGEGTFSKVACGECIVLTSLVARKDVLERTGLFHPFSICRGS